MAFPDDSVPFRPQLEDRWRSSTACGRGPRKEWQHVIVFGRGFELLLNFNIQRSEDAELVARVIVLFHDDGWSGFIDDVPPHQLAVSHDGAHAKFGGHALRIGERGYRVVVNSPARDWFVDLVLQPESQPMIARSQEIARGRHLDWTMLPRMTARGEAIIDGRWIGIRDALAYHDHNWGDLAWGDDFSWEWAVATADDGGPWTAVYSALRNRSGGVIRLRQAFLWERAENVLAASGADVHAHPARSSFDHTPYRLPAPLTLLCSPTFADLPSRLELKADHPAGAMELELDFLSRCELLVPSERDPLGLVVLHECSALAHAHGHIERRPFSWKGRAVYEMLAG